MCLFLKHQSELDGVKGGGRHWLVLGVANDLALRQRLLQFRNSCVGDLGVVHVEPRHHLQILLGEFGLS